ncbi:putative vinorine synthase [Helianthus annuus]|nr:putative vinorine synthase [Helianthus annuus]KAJ0702368.1 putative vinorine synthase [Helianthus annuus]
MKFLFSAHKATQRFLNSQGYRLHGGYRRRFFHASNPIGLSKSYQMRSTSIYTGHQCYSTSTIQDAAESSNRLPNSNKIENYINNVDLEIISTETVKPSSPTPHHRRTFNFSIIDQVMYDVYMPSIFFFPNTDDKASVTDVVTKRLKHLKESLSETLTRFYPLAGKIMDNLHIECNDEGIYFREARVNQTLEDFIHHPDDERVRELMPDKPYTAESSIGNYVIGIQVNIFTCGGIGLSSSASHKIFDGQSFSTFMKAWTTTARGSPKIISPSFVASKIFPSNPCFNFPLSPKLLATKMLRTKRFVFNSTALAMLKAQLVASASSTHPPTRTEATSVVIWKAAAKAASKVRPFGPQSPHALLSLVNIRQRASPPLPKESIGNLIATAGVICFPHGQLDLPTMMGDLRESITRIDSDHIESQKGVKGHETFIEVLQRLNQLMDVTAEGNCLAATSLLNSGMYDLDFGWGKPIWFYVMNPRVSKTVALNETLKDGGVEAIVTLSPDEMEILERDSELLSYATVNPSPLRFVH